MSNRAPLAQDPALSADATVGYYGIPAIHGGHWNWMIPAYFYLGGISGSAAAIAGLAKLVDPDGTRTLCRTATFVSFAALVPCPALLILDLGRPARFLNMLRAFRTSSVMSMGTWGLTAFAALLSAAVARELATAGRTQPIERQPSYPSTTKVGPMLDAACVGAGLFVAGYTGVLLAATAVPLWSKRPQLLAALFLTAAISSGAAAIHAVSALQAPHPDDPAFDALHHLEIVATAAKGALYLAWVTSLGETAGPLNDGKLRPIAWDTAVGVGVAAPLVLHAIGGRLPPRGRRAAVLLASACALVGGLALRYAVVQGGRMSADDPAATFSMTG